MAWLFVLITKPLIAKVTKTDKSYEAKLQPFMSKELKQIQTKTIPLEQDAHETKTQPSEQFQKIKEKQKPETPFDHWHNKVNKKIEKLHDIQTNEQKTIQSIIKNPLLKSLKIKKQIGQSERKIKVVIYNILTELKKIMNEHESIHDYLSNDEQKGRSWYQRWLGLPPQNSYQYFEKYIFPLLENAPIYKGLADQGVVALIASYIKDIEKHINYIENKEKLKKDSDPFIQILNQLKSTFNTYKSFLATNNNHLPVGSLMRLGSSPLFRYTAKLLGASAAGAGTAYKFGLDPRKMLAEKKEMTEALAKQVTLEQKAAGAWSVAKQGFSAAREQTKRAFQSPKDEAGIIKRAWRAAKSGTEEGIKKAKQTYTNLGEGWGLQQTKGLENIGKVSDYTYQKALESYAGKGLAALVAGYLGYRTVQWLMSDWPREKFTP